MLKYGSCPPDTRVPKACHHKLLFAFAQEQQLFAVQIGRQLIKHSADASRVAQGFVIDQKGWLKIKRLRKHSHETEMLCPLIGGKGDDASSGKYGPQRYWYLPARTCRHRICTAPSTKAGEVMAGFGIEDQPVIAQVFWGFRQSI